MKMSSYRIIYIALLSLIFIGSSVSADFDKTKWEFCKAIKGQVNTNLAYVLLDREVLLNSAYDYTDLRIIDSIGKEKPFKLIELIGKYAIESIIPKATNISVVPGKYSSITLNLGKRMRSNRLLINTTDENFICRVEIAGTNGSGPWEVLRSDAYIFDFSRGNRARSAEVTYPESDYNTLRIRIFADGKRIIKANGATVVWKKSQSRKTTVLYDGKGTKTENLKNKTTEISMKLPGSNLPAGSVRILSSTPNYQRQISVLGSHDGKNWNYIGNGYILKYKTEKFKENVSNIGFHAGYYDHIKIEICNGDDEPISVDRVVLDTEARRLVFEPERKMNYKLFYGNRSVISPVYDIQNLYNYLSGSASRSAELVLGPQLPNPDYIKVIIRKPWLETNKWVIWIATGAVMLILIAYILKHAKQLKAGTP